MVASDKPAQNRETTHQQKETFDEKIWKKQKENLQSNALPLSYQYTTKCDAALSMDRTRDHSNVFSKSGEKYNINSL